MDRSNKGTTKGSNANQYGQSFKELKDRDPFFEQVTHRRNTGFVVLAVPVRD
jgi:hypothetical protein